MKTDIFFYQKPKKCEELEVAKRSTTPIGISLVILIIYIAIDIVITISL